MARENGERSSRGNLLSCNVSVLFETSIVFNQRKPLFFNMVQWATSEGPEAKSKYVFKVFKYKYIDLYSKFQSATFALSGPYSSIANLPGLKLPILCFLPSYN